MHDLELETVVVKLRDRVAWVTLNRPAALNALNARMGRELLDAVTAVAADPDVRVLVLRGAGRGFCSGADLSAATEHPDISAALREVLHPLIVALRELERPVIAAVHGTAAGYGCSLALAADLVITARSARFALSFANVGLGLDGGSSSLLVARVGHARASEMALLAQPLDAEQALAWGLANRVVDDIELDSSAHGLAQQLARGAPGALAAIKLALNRAAHPRLAEQLELEADLQQQRGRSADFGEGIRAFLQKRPPQFTGD